MSRKTKRSAAKLQLVDGRPMAQVTQWVLIGSVAGVAAVKIIETSMTLSIQTLASHPTLASSNVWLSIFG